MEEAVIDIAHYLLSPARPSQYTSIMSRKAEYMMILRNTDWDADLSIEEVAEAIDRYQAWFDRLAGDGTITGGRPLFGGGRVVSLGKDGAVTDGPFVESKEVVGGYIVILASSLEEAAAIARTFPPVQLGVGIEVRELAFQCPVSVRHAEKLAALGVEAQPAELAPAAR
jgi:hypothetical protein